MIDEPSHPLVDLRSDAVTRPTRAMWHAMSSDPLDWSRMGDRTVYRLETLIAEQCGTEDALFVPSCTMANTLVLLTVACEDSTLLVDRDAHVLRAEGDAYRRLTDWSPVGLDGPRGHPTPDQISGATSRRPRLVWFENTHTHAGGTVAPYEGLVSASGIAQAAGAWVHMDGARLWNAAVRQGRTLAELVSPVDSVSVNLDKGLGCPAGALLCGPAGFIDEARERMLGLGGVLAQAGLLASCGLVALDDWENVIADAHAMAAHLAAGLVDTPGVEPMVPETNIVFVKVGDASTVQSRLFDNGVLVSMRDEETVRLVTHQQLDAAGVDRVLAVFTEISG